MKVLILLLLSFCLHVTTQAQELKEVDGLDTCEGQHPAVNIQQKRDIAVADHIFKAAK